MTELLTAAQMRAIEKAAMDSGSVTGLELMERAGSGVVEAIMEWWPELVEGPRHAVILCGPGNNGGDGFVIARLLKERGWEVDVFLFGDESRLPPDAAENCRRWRALGSLRASTELTDAAADIYIDALFGTGLTRSVEGEARRALCALGKPIVAVDLPSGLCSDSGRWLGPETERPETALTVTFHAPRVGHVLAGGPEACGVLAVKDIGLHRQASLAVLEEIRGQSSKETAQSAAVVSLVAPEPLRLRKLISGHKYNHGHALILSGGVGKGGAARMAARGALRIGAGLVTVGCPPAALAENAARLDAIMLRPVDGSRALADMLSDERLNAILIGPGHGGGEATHEMVLTALEARRPTVLDADALTAFTDDRATLYDALHEDCVLTPHAGEFARLFPQAQAMLSEPATRGPAFSKVDAARTAARQAGCTVLYKGADTVIADQTGAASVNAAQDERAVPWLATAGAGDVLAGFITGLLARGFPPKKAAETAAWLHVESAQRFGPGLIAEDLPEELPAVFRDLGV